MPTLNKMFLYTLINTILSRIDRNTDILYRINKLTFIL